MAGIHVLACGGGSPGTMNAGDGGTVAVPAVNTAPEFAEQMARLVCGAMKGCCARHTLPFDDRNCVERAKQQVPFGYAARFLDGVQTMQFNVAQARACLAQVAAASRSCFADGPAGPLSREKWREHDPCTHVVTSNRGLGEPCEGRGGVGSCAPPQTGFGRCVSGVCQHVVPVGRGETCNVVKDGVVGGCDRHAGLACDPMSHVCRALGSEGAACFESADCDPALGLGCENGRCRVPPRLGEPCTLGGLACADNLFCNGSNCQARQTMGACGIGPECPPAEYCAWVEQRCLPRKKVGERCMDKNESCVAGTSCVAIELSKPDLSHAQACVPKEYPALCPPL